MNPNEFKASERIAYQYLKGPSPITGILFQTGTLLSELLSEFTMTQCINQPTRFSSDATSYSVIDLFSTTRPDLVLSTDISHPISDHCCVTVRLNLPTVPRTTNKPRSLILPDFEHADWPGLREALSPRRCSRQSKALLTLILHGRLGKAFSWKF